MNRALSPVISLGLALASFSAFAGYEPWLQGPCREDAKKLCGDAISAGGDILACMRAHEGELSAGCKLKREERRTEVSAAQGDVKKDCAADIEKFCRKPVDAKPTAAKSEVGARGCMRENLANLSPACKAHFDAASARRPRGPKPAVKESSALEPSSGGTPLVARDASVGHVLSPSERTMTLVLAMNTTKPGEPLSPSAGADAESPPSLIQSIFGFDEEIESNDPATRAAIDQARVDSAIPAPAPAVPADNSSTEAL